MYNNRLSRNSVQFWETCSEEAIARNNKRTRRWPPVARREAEEERVVVRRARARGLGGESEGGAP